MSLTQTIRELFLRTYPGKPQLFRAPGRINIIGEHTDYNEGFVLPAAIDKEIVYALAASPDGRSRAYAWNFSGEYVFNHRYLEPADKPNRWANYLLGVVQQLQRLGAEVPPFNCVFGGNVPSGAGMSSSAAIECGLATALNEAFGLGIGRLDLAKAAQRAENEFVGIKCGIMDQFASVFGRAGQAMRLDCRSLEFAYFPLELGDYELLLCDSGVHHSLAASQYNTRRQQCETGVKWLQKSHPHVRSLRDVTADLLAAHAPELDPVVLRRCQYVVAENQRLIDACQALEQADFGRVGQLLYGSHHGLQHDYEVSCPELDLLVGYAQAEPGIAGARMMGGGFGGCTLNLVRTDSVEKFVQQATQQYKRATGIDLKTYRVHPADGAGRVVE
jgi:galactokinase